MVEVASLFNYFFTLIPMSNFDLWYFFGIAILGVSFTYITLAAVQFMGAGKKENKSSPGSNNAPPGRFIWQVLLAFGGIMIGAELLQYHQDQATLSKKDIGREMARANVLSNKPSGASGSKRMNARPTSRPPRGEFSLSEVGKTGVSVEKNSRGSVKEVPATVAPVVNPLIPSK